MMKTGTVLVYSRAERRTEWHRAPIIILLLVSDMLGTEWQNHPFLHTPEWCVCMVCA